MMELEEIRPGQVSFEKFLGALRAENLPTVDLFTEPFSYFSWNDAAWGGIGAGRDALLRSLVVTAEARGKGVGALVVTALADAAHRRGVDRLWLLTTNASAFFTRLGWRDAERGGAPPAIAGSAQFSGLCPASATLMVRTL